MKVTPSPSAQELIQRMHADLAKSTTDAQDRLANDLLDDMYDRTPAYAKTTSRPNFLRRWLGWKLWKLAGWVNPEVLS